MSRKRKKDPAIVRIAEAVGVTVHSDVMSLDELKEFPDFTAESERNQGVMCAVACGYSQAFIAKMFKIAQPSIFEIVHRIDPDGLFRVSPKAKKAFVTKLAESRAVEALSSITPEKLEDASAVELSRIGKTMMELSAQMNQTKHKEIGSNRMDMLMEQIANESVDAEIIEENGDK